MTDSRPRDLTMAELERLNVPASRGGESMPLPIPNGMLTPIGAFNPSTGSTAATAAPTATPPDTIDGRGAGAS